MSLAARRIFHQIASRRICYTRQLAFSSSTPETNEKPEKKADLGTLKKASWLDKRILLWTKMYEKESDIPEFIDVQGDYRKAKDKANVMWNATIMLFMVVCYLVGSKIYRGRSQVKGDFNYRELTKPKTE